MRQQDIKAILFGIDSPVNNNGSYYIAHFSFFEIESASNQFNCSEPDDLLQTKSNRKDIEGFRISSFLAADNICFHLQAGYINQRVKLCCSSRHFIWHNTVILSGTENIQAWIWTVELFVQIFCISRKRLNYMDLYVFNVVFLPTD